LIDWLRHKNRPGCEASSAALSRKTGASRLSHEI
jgi:hypothetical protein